MESLRKLFAKAGDTSHEGELKELLAHAYVETGNLGKARDLYKELADSEPENPLHAQNYKQVTAKLGEDSVDKPLTAEQGAQAFMMEEVDQKAAPAIKQDYPNEIAMAVQSAITDSELFDSYNLPAKAIAPLEACLSKAPRDFQLNLRLSTYYAKVERWAEAARAANIVKELYAEFGHPQQSQQYAELYKSYMDRAPESARAAAAASPPPPEVEPHIISLKEAVATEPTVSGFGFSAEAGTPPASGFSVEVPVPPPPVAVAPPPPPPPPAAASAEGAHEINMDEWESMLTVEAEAAPAEAAAPPPIEVAPPIEVEGQTDDASVAEFSFEAQAEPEPAPPPPPRVVAPPPKPKVVAPPPKPVAAPPPPKAVAKAKPAPAEEEDLLGDLVSDLEESLGDFDLGTPAARDSSKAAAAAASAPSSAPPPAPVDPESVPAGFSSMGHEMPKAAPQIAKKDADSALADMFSEFKEDAEESAGQAEDPDTHYNLGIAFKEMGLLDEAIGELQKVCHAVEHGSQFSQVMQAYTWLAQCLVDKGVPQAAVRWYEKALPLTGTDEQSRLAVSYDLACAYEMAGNQKKAYEIFMEVYGSNIDYRDVAERIKTLKV